METEGKTNQGDAYEQSGNFGISDMSGGEIKDRAKVAGVINEGSTYNYNSYHYNSPDRLPLFIKLLAGFIVLSTCLALIFSKVDRLYPLTSSFDIKAEELSKKSFNHQEFKIKYPQDWHLQRVDDLITGEVVKILPPQEDQQNQAYISVIIENLSNHPLTLNEYTTKSIQEITKSSEYSRFIGFIENGSTTFANRNSHKLIYSSQDQKSEYINLEVWTLYNNKAYIIHYKSQKKEYDKFSNTVKNIINSFEICY